MDVKPLLTTLLYYSFIVSIPSIAQVVAIASGTQVTGNGAIRLVVDNGGFRNNQ